MSINSFYLSNFLLKLVDIISFTQNAFQGDILLSLSIEKCPVVFEKSKEVFRVIEQLGVSIYNPTHPSKGLNLGRL